MSNYSTNLTEKQWQVIKNIVEPQEKSRKYLTIEVAPKFGQNHFYLNKL